MDEISKSILAANSYLNTASLGAIVFYFKGRDWPYTSSCYDPSEVATYWM